MAGSHRLWFRRSSGRPAACTEKTMTRTLILASLALALVAGCKRGEEPKPEAPAAQQQPAAEPAKPAAPAAPAPEKKPTNPALADPAKLTEKAPEKYEVKFDTTKGAFTV